MSRPDFLIVGAPKCGTTAMARYLSAHPQLFLADRKDLHYFGADLQFTQRPPRSSSAYHHHFQDAQPGQRVGEASVWYLSSAAAAAEIHTYNPDMSIIIMLRNPVDMMHALYTQLRFNGLGDEDLPTFEAALAAEPDRAEGRRLPPNTPLPSALRYRHAATFSEQVARYQAVFPAAQLHIVLQDDLKADTAASYQQTLSFLGVDSGFQPDLRPVNANKQVRSERLRKAIAFTPGTIKGLIPDPLRRGVRKQLKRLNARHAKRPPMDPALRGQLCGEFRPEIERLAAQIDRDLSAWLSA